MSERMTKAGPASTETERGAVFRAVGRRRHNGVPVPTGRGAEQEITGCAPPAIVVRTPLRPVGPRKRFG